MQDLRDLEIMLDSRIPLIVIETHEEIRALQLVARVGLRRARPVYAWSCTEGIRRVDADLGGNEREQQEPEELLRFIKAGKSPAIWALCDFHPFMPDQPKLIRLLKEIAQQYEQIPHVILFLSHQLQLPPELSRYGAQMSLALPTEPELLRLVREEASLWSRANSSRKVRTDPAALDALVANLRGLNFADSRRLARLAIHNDGAITSSDLAEVNRAKFTLMRLDEVLSYEYDTASFADVGGLASLKEWLNLRKRHFQPRQSTDAAPMTTDAPKGILLLGVQGSGKSLAAKASAGSLGLPLLRLDLAALYNKFVGETERNLREALNLAELMAPCVLWIDEIEKGVGSEESDQGVSKRVLGTLLTWMAERKTAVFVVATSNDISRLPPELIRKGRLDEIFFVDLPSMSVREQILTIHLKKRNQNAAEFDLGALATATEGFSGAEIEQVVVSALYSSAAEPTQLTTEHLLRSVVNTAPLSVVMAEKIAALRQWAKHRTVSAD
ncbi:AAA ATPase [gamma proteobacterium HdN1]|nr:AAA ATPase [gamma proteobacterium HdN1]